MIRFELMVFACNDAELVMLHCQILTSVNLEYINAANQLPVPTLLAVTLASVIMVILAMEHTVKVCVAMSTCVCRNTTII